MYYDYRKTIEGQRKFKHHKIYWITLKLPYYGLLALLGTTNILISVQKILIVAINILGEKRGFGFNSL